MSTLPVTSSPAHAWMRALELTSLIPKQRHRTLPVAIEQMAEIRGEAPALLSDRASMTYVQLAQRIRKYARWAIAQDLGKGDVVCLLAENQPEYLACWLGLVSSGVVVSLLNTSLAGTSLAHSIRIVSPKMILADSVHTTVIESALPHMAETARPSVREMPPLGLEGCSAHSFPPGERDDVGIDDLALYIYTSGTTGLPKAARITHARLLQWAYWFSGLMRIGSADRTYNCLPMYHSVGGAQVPGAMLLAGASVVIRPKFSATAFWEEVVRWDCTLFQYIGELCRYLLATPPSLWERRHRLRLACGNGLAPAIWTQFQDRFAIPHILEFYASTEGNVSLFNVEGRPGAVGHVPRYLAHRFAPPLVQSDPETHEPVRGSDGFCIRCEQGRTGEALGRYHAGQSSGRDFDGYTDEEASKDKLLRNVFEPGDAWFRTGDMFRRDEAGFYYFVDRIGDTFRRKGENVATAEVAACLSRVPGVRHAVVYGVTVPQVEGRIGMAALVVDSGFALPALQQEISENLPSHARPVFLRIQEKPKLTGTWKYSKAELIKEGFDPGIIGDPLFLDLPGSSGYVPLDADVYRSLQTGTILL